MKEYVRSIFTDEEWKLLTEDEIALCTQVMALPTEKQPDEERMRDANGSLASTSK